MDYRELRRAIVLACDAVLLKSEPRLNPDTPEQRFVLRRVLNELVWKYSEATPYSGGKYLGCEWWSKGALESYTTDATSFESKMHLEHVKDRKFEVNDLIASKNIHDIEDALNTIVTCVVLRDEHRRFPKKYLRPKLDRPDEWWKKYGTLSRVRGPNARSSE